MTKTSKVSLGLFIALSMPMASNAAAPKWILSAPDLLKKAGIPVIQKDAGLGVALALVNAAQEAKLQEHAHDFGRCGGYEILPSPLSSKSSSKTNFEALIANMKTAQTARVAHKAADVHLERDPRVEQAASQVSADNIGATVKWYSAFGSRYQGLPTANDPVKGIKTKLEEILVGAKTKFTVEMVRHRNTEQNSVRVHFEGSEHPSEIVVLGGHLDSINRSDENDAPGADDNASGTACLIETVRILAGQDKAPQRSIEVFWYAAEEIGLVGSAEIAQNYKQAKKDVVGAFQLDMTSYIGGGELHMSSIDDFTSPWLKSLILEVNRLYVGAKVDKDECGYACSDHASWYRQGYSTVFPFEAPTDVMNPDIHTTQDTIGSRTSFTHAAAFSKLALGFAMHLANSQLRGDL